MTNVFHHSLAVCVQPCVCVLSACPVPAVPLSGSFFLLCLLWRPRCSSFSSMVLILSWDSFPHIFQEHLLLSLKGFSSPFLLLTLLCHPLYGGAVFPRLLLWALMLQPNSPLISFYLSSAVTCSYVILLGKVVGKKKWEITDVWLHPFLQIACWSCG